MRLYWDGTKALRNSKAVGSALKETIDSRIAVSLQVNLANYRMGMVHDRSCRRYGSQPRKASSSRLVRAMGRLEDELGSTEVQNIEFHKAGDLPQSLSQQSKKTDYKIRMNQVLKTGSP